MEVQTAQNPLPTSEVPLSPSIPQIEIKPKNWLVILLVTFTVLFSLGTAGFFGYQYIQQKQQAAITTFEACSKALGSVVQTMYPPVCVTHDGKQFAQQLTPEEQQNLLPPDPTADWKTYTNTKYGFSIKYNPNNEPVETLGSGQQIYLIGFGTMKNNGFDIEISTGDKLDYYKNRIIDHTTGNIDKEEKITADGVVGTKLTYKQIIVIDKFDVSQVIINKKDRDYIITALSSDIDQILSTFQFTDTQPENKITCGGFAGKKCPGGYTCQIDDKYPDAMGTCIRE